MDPARAEGCAGREPRTTADREVGATVFVLILDFDFGEAVGADDQQDGADDDQNEKSMRGSNAARAEEDIAHAVDAVGERIGFGDG